MNNYLLWIVLPSFEIFFTMLGVVGLVSSAILAIAATTAAHNACGEEEIIQAKKFSKFSITALGISVLLLFISCFLPSKKALMQLKVISVVSELKNADKIPQKLVDKINLLLDSIGESK